jgi:hypothetical protein
MWVWGKRHADCSLGLPTMAFEDGYAEKVRSWRADQDSRDNDVEFAMAGLKYLAASR